MAADNDLGDRKIVNLERGLFLIEYRGAGDEASPAKVVVSQVPGRGRVEFVAHPDFPDDLTLWQPNSALVVRAFEPSVLHITVSPTRPGGTRAAEVSIRPITPGTSPASTVIDLEVIRLVGHVAGRGDVAVALGEWIAGPSAPSRIEGLALQWPNQPSGLEIKYSVRIGSVQAPMSPTVGAGQFAGSRGRALPLTGLIMEISGNLSAHYNLIADAIFLSQPAMRASGKRVVLAGPTGQEPLVGLRLSLQPVQDAVAAPPKQAQNPPARATNPPARATNPPASAAPAPPPQRSAAAGRVRVFRSRSNNK